MLFVKVAQMIYEALLLIWNGSQATEWWHYGIAIVAGIVVGYIAMIAFAAIYSNLCENIDIDKKIRFATRWQKILITFLISGIIIEIAYDTCELFQATGWMPQTIFFVLIAAFVEVTIALIAHDLPLWKLYRQTEETPFGAQITEEKVFYVI